jgi:8-oxo-dGTP pyrophosphatase MutT (NUDIX family)
MKIPDLPEGLIGDEKSVELIRAIFELTPLPFCRQQFRPGHVTATGLVLHPDGEGILMVMHGWLRRWLLPGGHVEEEVDGDVLDAAAREVFEETGIQVNGGEIIGADVHPIPAKVRGGMELEPYHLHHDILVRFQAAETALKLSEESSDLRWVWPADFDAYSVPANVRRAYARLMAR